MSYKTGISWTDATWNPVTGCTRVSPGCASCYIERTPPFRINHRKFERVGNESTTGVTLHPGRLDQPLRWKKPRRIFVCSMGDLFHEDVPDKFIMRVFAVMALAPQHSFQVLTKRPERMAKLLNDITPHILDTDERSIGERPYVKRWEYGEEATWPLPNVWLGTSVENPYWADPRIPWLLRTPAAVRFLSCEPLLSSLGLTPWLVPEHACSMPSHVLPGNHGLRLPRIHQVIVGGESGPKHRPMDLDWARRIRDDCVNAGVAFFFKQSSGPRPGGNATLDGVEWRQFPSEVKS